MISIGVIGAGYWGANIVRTFANIGTCCLKAVADPKPGRQAYIRQSFPAIEVRENYRDILEDSDIEAVAIATPVHTHFEIAREALLAGKHIYVEKPFTHSSKAAKELILLASRLQKKILVGHLFLYHPVIKKLKELVDSEQIGQVYCIDARRMNLRPPSSEVNVVWDLAPHDLSIVFYLIGEIPTRMRAHGRAFKNSRLEDSVTITIEFEGNRYANVYVNWLSSCKTREMMIFGTRGSMTYDDMQPVDKIRVYGEGIDTRIHAKDEDTLQLLYKPGDIVIPSIPSGQPLDIECRHFIECIEHDQPILSDGSNGYQVVRALECIDLSLAKDGDWICYQDDSDV